MRRTKAYLLAASFVALGCGRPDPGLPVFDPNATPAPSTRGRPVLRVLDAGESTGPRAELRYDLTRNLPPRVKVDIRALSREGGTVEVVLSLSPNEPTPPNEARFYFTIESAKLAGATPPGLAPLIGVRGTALVSDRGVLSEFGWSQADELPPAANQVLVDLGRVLRLIYPPLPDQPVGRNASWSAKTDIVSIERYRTITVLTYVLRTFDERGFVLDVEFRQRSGSVAPDVPDAVQATGKGSGAITIDTARGRSQVDLSLELTAERDSAPRAQRRRESASEIKLVPLD